MDGKYILIASADKELNKKIKSLFKDNPITFANACDERLAMEMIVAKEYDAAIVDVDLTAVSSYDFLYRLRMLRPSMPVIAVSSVLTADNILLAYDFGVMDIIDKNFMEGELETLVNTRVLNVAI